MFFDVPKSSFGEHKDGTKDNSIPLEEMCWVFWDDMTFCNNFARWNKR